MRRLLNRQTVMGALLLLQFTLVNVWSDETVPVADLDGLIATALNRNPDLEASEAEWQMFVQKARQAGSFEDPMMMIGINNALIRDPFVFDSDSMTSRSIGLSQMVPFFGKRALARQGADLEALSARARFEERRLELAAMVKEFHAGLFFIDQALNIVDRSLVVMDDMLRFTEARYGVGAGMQQDVLRAQVERSRMLDMQIGLQQQKRSLAAAMNRLLARPADTPIGAIPVLETPPVMHSAEELERMAGENRPLLAGLLRLAEKSQVDEALAGKEFYPDFTFSLEYMQREPAMGEAGYDMYNASVSFNLPVQRQRRHAMVAEAKAATRMAQAEVVDLRNAIVSGIADLLAKLERSAQLIELYRTGVIPQAARSFEAAQIAYGNNQVDFQMMLESLLSLFNDEREYYDALADYRMNLARLEALVGSELMDNP